jgi:phosphoribosylglycinamide formyltransferase-1
VVREPALRLAVLISGRGSNLRALIDAIDEGRLDAQIVAAICNHRDAPGIQRAQAAGIATYVVVRRDYASREAQHEAMLACAQRHGAELIVLGGFDRILSRAWVQAYPNRIINVHPSLLPAFAGGMNPKPQQDALEAGAKIAGCTVHIATDDVDAGPIIAQAAVPVLMDDTVESLANRILAQEHRLLPCVVQWFAEGRVGIENDRVRVAGVIPSRWWNEA